MERRLVKLYLVTGFLGSGKTSVINSLLSLLADRKVGLILNDFGSIAVDGALVEGSDSIVSLKSLSGGQIFCSCLSGSFINAVQEMAPLGPEVILVEASGLAKPAPLLEIVSVIRKQTKGQVEYGGMLCVVDAERFPLLSKSLKTLEEQMVFSDWFIVNKIDLVDKEQLESTIGRIESLRPLAPVFKTSFGKVSQDFLEALYQPLEEERHASVNASSYRGWGVEGRPKTCVFFPNNTFQRSSLERFLREVSSQMLRMKGFVPTGDGKVLLVDAVGPHVTVSERTMPDSMKPGIVCIHSTSVDAVELLKHRWQHFGKGDATCIPTV